MVDGHMEQNVLAKITEMDVLAVYEQLKDQYDIVLTTTSAVDDGFTIDCPILVGQTHGLIMWLYAYEDIFIMDVMDEAKTKGTHWHPDTVEDAVRDMREFLNGRGDYRMETFQR